MMRRVQRKSSMSWPLISLSLRSRFALLLSTQPPFSPQHLRTLGTPFVVYIPWLPLTPCRCPAPSPLRPWSPSAVFLVPLAALQDRPLLSRHHIVGSVGGHVGLSGVGYVRYVLILPPWSTRTLTPLVCVACASRRDHSPS